MAETNARLDVNLEPAVSRAPWQRPQWRKLDAREAETGGANNTDLPTLHS